MTRSATAPSRFVRPLVLALGLLLAASLGPWSLAATMAAEASPEPAAQAAEASPEPAASPAPTIAPTIAPAEALCESAADLRLIIEFLQQADASEDGWLPIIVGVIAGLGEARTLVGLVDETYRPLVDELVVSLQEVRVMLDSLAELETTGARIAAVGEAITRIGNAMDALSVQLQTRCPSDAE